MTDEFILKLPVLKKLKSGDDDAGLCRKSRVTFKAEVLKLVEDEDEKFAENEKRLENSPRLTETSPQKIVNSPRRLSLRRYSDARETLVKMPNLNDLRQSKLEENMFMGVQGPAADKLALLSWKKYVRTREDIHGDLEKSLKRCKTFFSNVGIPFNYHLGDDQYKRRELRQSWRERRRTGIISTMTEQDAFVLDSMSDDDDIDNIIDTEDNQEMILSDIVKETKKIAHRGAMTNMVNSYCKRMVIRLQGLKDLEAWLLRLKHEEESKIENLEEIDDMLEQSWQDFKEARYCAKSMVKTMRRLLRKMGEKHSMMQNRMKVTSRLRERAAMNKKDIRIDYTNLQTINRSFEDIINRQLMFLTMNKKLSREAQDNDEKLRKIQTHMTRCVKELSDDKEKLFHKNHLLENDKNRLEAKVKLQSEEIQFYQNQQEYRKDMAMEETGKTIESLETELSILQENYDRVCMEEEALRNEVQELHDQVLNWEVEFTKIKEELAEKTLNLNEMEIMLNEEKVKYADKSENYIKLMNANVQLRTQREAVKPDVVDQGISSQSLEYRKSPVSGSGEDGEVGEPEIVYINKTVDSCHVATDTSDLAEELELTTDKHFQTEPVEFAEDKKRGLTDPFTNELMADNMNFLNNVKQRKSRVDDTAMTTQHARVRPSDTPAYTQMIVKRLKEEREHDIGRLADYIKREKARTEATSRRISHEHKRSMKQLRREIRTILMSILRHRDKMVQLFSKHGVVLEGLTQPSIQEFKNDKNDKTTVSMKHTAIEILNSMDYNSTMGLKEIQLKVRETVLNQKNVEKELALKNRKLEKSTKTVETFDAKMQQLKRDCDRLRLREQFMNERYRELLKREEELERAEEAHVTRIEQRLSEMWNKSATDIEGGLDEILQVKRTQPAGESQLRRMSRPHRPRDRLVHTITTDTFDTSESLKTLDLNTDLLEEDSEEDEPEEQSESDEEEDSGPIEINNVGNKPPKEDLSKGTLYKGQVMGTHQAPQSESEWSETKSLEVQQYIEDMQTVKPATIIHPVADAEGKFLHFDSSVAKIDEMYTVILHGEKGGRRKRRDAMAIGDPTILHINNQPAAEMQLTILGVDQMWNTNTLKVAYEAKNIGIRVYSNSLDLIRRNLSLKGARLSMMAKRLMKTRNLDCVETALIQNEGNEIENQVVFDVLNKLPLLRAKQTASHFDKVAKLIRLNTYILAEQVRVYQQIRDTDLSMKLKWPYPVLEDNGTRIVFDQLRSEKPTKGRKPRARRSSLVKVEYPASIDSILTTSGVLNKNNSKRFRMWKNPCESLGYSDAPDSRTKPLPVPHMLLLDCNALKPHNLPTESKPVVFNPHKAVPPINKPTASKVRDEKRDSASFTLPIVQTYSSADSGYDGSHVILDPAKYM